MKKIFKKAHEMTREMVKEYKVDYQAQFGLNLSYLLEKEEEEEMKELKGTEKQVKFANDIRTTLIESLDKALEAVELVKKEKTREKNRNKIQNFKDEIINIEDAAEIIENYQNFLYENKRNEMAGFNYLNDLKVISGRVLTALHKMK